MIEQEQDTEATDERSSNGLPQGWAWASFDSLVSLVQNGLSKRRSDGGTPHIVLRLADVVDGKVSFDNARYIGLTSDEIDRYMLTPDDLLCVRVNGSRSLVGRMIRMPLTKDPIAFCDHFIRFRPDESVAIGYLTRYFDSDGVRSYISLNAVSSAGQNTVNQGIIGGIPIPVPPLAEQRRIVAEIDKQFSRIDAGIMALKRVQTALKRYRAAVLKAAVEGTLTEEWRAQHPDVEPASDLLGRILDERRKAWEQAELARFAKAGKRPSKGWQAKYREPESPDTTNLPTLPEGWCWTRFEQLIIQLRNGLPQKPDTSPPGHPILRINAVRPMHVDLGEVRFLDLPLTEVSDYFIEDGDILFTRYNGSLELLGVAGLVRGCARPTLHPDKLIRAKTALPGILPVFLELVSNVGASRSYIERKARTTAGQTGISGDDLKQMPIPLPPLAEQEQIVAEVERRLPVVAETEAQVAAELRRAERLRQGILALAFAGKLVPQDPADEPASALLERIRAEKGQAKGGKGKPEGARRGDKRWTERAETGDAVQLRLV